MLLPFMFQRGKERRLNHCWVYALICCTKERVVANVTIILCLYTVLFFFSETEYWGIRFLYDFYLSYVHIHTYPEYARWDGEHGKRRSDKKRL